MQSGSTAEKRRPIAATFNIPPASFLTQSTTNHYFGSILSGGPNTSRLLKYLVTARYCCFREVQPGHSIEQIPTRKAVIRRFREDFGSGARYI